MKTNSMRVKTILMRLKKILVYFRKNTADNLTFNEELVELVNGDLEVVVKVIEVQKDVQDVVVVVVAVDPPVGAAGRLGVRRRRKRAR